jgi:hypothetical protein
VSPDQQTERSYIAGQELVMTIELGGKGTISPTKKRHCDTGALIGRSNPLVLRRSNAVIVFFEKILL